jgi:hypothetical protein
MIYTFTHRPQKVSNKHNKGEKSKIGGSKGPIYKLALVPFFPSNSSCYLVRSGWTTDSVRRRRPPCHRGFLGLHARNYWLNHKAQ